VKANIKLDIDVVGNQINASVQVKEGTRVIDGIDLVDTTAHMLNYHIQRYVNDLFQEVADELTTSH
jgi:hypothetical protein